MAPITHWMGTFITSPDAQSGAELLVGKTPAAVKATATDVSDPRRCREIAERLTANHFLTSLAWWVMAIRPGDSAELNNAGTLSGLLTFAKMAQASVKRDEAIARLETWLEIVQGHRAAYGVDLFAYVEKLRKKEAGKPAPAAEPEIVGAIETAVEMLAYDRWDVAAHALFRLTVATPGLSCVNDMLPKGVLLSPDRNAVRGAIERFVDHLFSLGDERMGKLAVAWMMLVADPKRPAQFAHFMPQLQRMVDNVLLKDAEQQRMLPHRIAAWWDAADGEFDESPLSVFALAALDPDVTMAELVGEKEPTFGHIRRATEAKKQAQPAGPSLVVMPMEKGSKLNNYHGLFKEIADAALPLVVVRDLARIRSTLHAEYPHATAQVDMLLRDLHEDKPFRMKPVLLLGSPGCGKSRMVRRLCELVGAFCYRFDAASSNDNMFGGVSKAWGNTEASVPARAVAQSKSASPVVMVDEIEKAGEHWQAGGLHSAILPFLERETAARFRDPSLDWELDLSAVSFVATANSVEKLPAPLRDRFRVIRVPEPSMQHLPQLAAGVMREMARDDELRAHDEPLADDELEVLGRAWRRAGFSMRMLQKIVGATLDARDTYARRH